jgi:Tfp pilus assembly protein PilO
MNAQLSMSHAGWTLKRWLINLRWPGLVGLGLLLFTAGLTAVGIQSTRQRLHDLKQEAATLNSHLGNRGAVTVPITGRSQLSNFYAFFPLTQNVPELLGRINRAAQQHALVLQKGEYKLSREPEFRLARYQVTLPVSGDYAKVRGFVNDVLEAVPSAALEELTLKREAIDLPELESRVRFTLFLGTD